MLAFDLDEAAKERLMASGRSAVSEYAQQHWSAPAIANNK
jgi:hypothetical protein